MFPVGKLAANPFGLYDLHGNVWEWCWDCHGEYATAAVSDPAGPVGAGSRVLRGGSVGNSAPDVRSANRNTNLPVYRTSIYGFRAARTYP